MKNFSKYLISLFLAFVVMANDGAVDSQSRSPAYYQSSFVVLKRELEFKSSRFYIFNKVKAVAKTSFSVLIAFLNFEKVFSFQIIILQKLQKELHQNLSSFISQFVFLNEISISNNTFKSLYSA